MVNFIDELNKVPYNPPPKMEIGKNFDRVGSQVDHLINDYVKKRFISQAARSRHLSVNFSFYARISLDSPFNWDDDTYSGDMLRANIYGSQAEIRYFFTRLAELCASNSIQVKMYISQHANLPLIIKIQYPKMCKDADGMAHMALGWPNIRPMIEFSMDI